MNHSPIAHTDADIGNRLHADKLVVLMRDSRMACDLSMATSGAPSAGTRTRSTSAELAPRAR